FLHPGRPSRTDRRPGGIAAPGGKRLAAGRRVAAPARAGALALSALALVAGFVPLTRVAAAISKNREQAESRRRGQPLPAIRSGKGDRGAVGKDDKIVVPQQRCDARP